PERRRASLRRVRQTLKVHLADHLEETVERVGQPVLVLYGDTDRLCTEAWARELSTRSPDGRFETLPGAHSFVWTSPAAWSEQGGQPDGDPGRRGERPRRPRSPPPARRHHAAGQPRLMRLTSPAPRAPQRRPRATRRRIRRSASATSKATGSTPP